MLHSAVVHWQSVILQLFALAKHNAALYALAKYNAACVHCWSRPFRDERGKSCTDLPCSSFLLFLLLLILVIVGDGGENEMHKHHHHHQHHHRGHHVTYSCDRWWWCWDAQCALHPQRGQPVTKMVSPMTGKSIENANHFSSCKNSSPLFLVQKRITIHLEIMVTRKSNCSCSGKGGTQGVNWEAPEMGCTGGCVALRTRQDNDSIMRRPTGYLHPNWAS